MPTVKPRDRVVVFRLTEDEYNALKDACTERGGRNLSDFTRSELMTGISSEPLHLRLEARFSTIEERLRDLQQGLERLSRLLSLEQS